MRLGIPNPANAQLMQTSLRPFRRGADNATPPDPELGLTLPSDGSGETGGSGVATTSEPLGNS
jgi:hypothetical protein